MSVPFNCIICGNQEWANFVQDVRDRLITNQHCFNCDFWQEKIRWRKEGKNNAFVIQGSHVVVSPDEPESDRRWSGCGGSKFVILTHDGRRIVTHNLWHQGKVPDRFRDVLTDNATFEKV